MKLKEWLRTRKNWQKGAIIGILAGLIYLFATLARDGLKVEQLPTFLILAPIYCLLLPAVVGAIIGFFSSVIKNNPLKWGVCLATIPFIVTCFTYYSIYSRNWNDAGTILILIFLPFLTILCFVVGLLIGYIIKKRSKNEK